MSQEHYFSADPGAPAEYRDISFEVGGQLLQVQSASGTFSASRLDPGTSVLLKHSSEFPTAGNVLDLGCGWGPISLSIAKLNPETTLWALDVNQRSLSLVESNAKKLGLTNVRPVLAEQIPDSVNFNAIWSNPPIRVGKKVLHQLLQTWLPRLSPGGVAMLVVQKQLGADSLLSWIQSEFPEFQAQRHSTDKGFR
ncbi:MAG: hypothetical protein RL418_876, partial [Actinomycetota bacterium]